MNKPISEKERIVSDKLTMLFVFEKMEIPLTEDSILDICSVKNEWIKNYMDCKTTIHDLVDENLLYKISNEGDTKELFALTYEGRECLSQLYQRLSLQKREEISTYIQANKLSVKSSQEYHSTYKKNPDGSYNVELKIYEPQSTVPMFDLTIKAPTRQSANEAVHKWKTNAPNIYEVIYEKLINID
jgi:hypothetical protein